MGTIPLPPKTSELIVTKIYVGEYIEDPYPLQNFINLITLFRPKICENSHQVRAVAKGVLSTPWWIWQHRY